MRLLFIAALALSASFALLKAQKPAVDTVGQSQNRAFVNSPTKLSPRGRDSLPQAVFERCSSFFEALMNESAQIAYDKLLKGSPLSLNKKKIDRQISQTLKAINLYGTVKGYEEASVEYVSPSYLKATFLSLHSLNPLKWTFTFYNSPTIGWIVLNIKYTDYF